MEYNNERIVFIEYRNADCGQVPFSVVTHREHGYSTYDFDYCGGNVCYHCSGFGGCNDGKIPISHFSEPDLKNPTKIWKADHIQLVSASNENILWTPEQIRLMGYEVINDPLDLSHLNYQNGHEANPFEVSRTIEGEAVWCSICQERHYDEWGVGVDCNYLFWDEYIGMYSGPGSDECKLTDYPDDLWFFIKQFPISAMPEWVEKLRANEFSLNCNSIHHPTEFTLRSIAWVGDWKVEIDNFNEEEMQSYMTGFNWIFCLGKKTEDDNQRVANLICNKLGWN